MRNIYYNIIKIREGKPTKPDRRINNMLYGIRKIPKMYDVHYIDNEGNVLDTSTFTTLSKALFDCYYWINKIRVSQIKIYTVDNDYCLHQIAELNK